MTVKIDGTNTEANPAFTGADTDTGLQCGTNEVKLVTGGTARATVDSSGRLGIGTASPAELLNLANSEPVMRFTDTDDSNYHHIFCSSDDFYISADRNNTGSGNLIFRNGGTSERMRILSSGGITFNGDTAATNALSDYEEGTWIPTPYLSHNPSNRVLAASGESGRYTKIGQIVHAWFGFNYSINGSGGFNLGINNLPFTAKSNAGFAYNGGGTARESQFTGLMFFAEGVTAGTTRLTVLRRYDNGSPRDPSGTMVGHVTYEAT